MRPSYTLQARSATRTDQIKSLEAWAEACWQLAGISMPDAARQWEAQARQASADIRALRAEGSKGRPKA